MNNPSDVYAGIAKRKQRAIDLHLREEVYWLFFSDLKYSQMPPTITEFTSPQANTYTFHFGGRKYDLVHIQGSSEIEYNGQGRRQEKTETTHGRITVGVDNVCSFSFNFEKIVADTREAPIFGQMMGQVTAFIEGAWVTDILSLRSQIKTYEQENSAKRGAPSLQKILEDMESFGL